MITTRTLTNTTPFAEMDTGMGADDMRSFEILAVVSSVAGIMAGLLIAMVLGCI